MALRLKGSYGLALLFTTGIVGWMATGETVYSGNESEDAINPPAVRNEQLAATSIRVAVKTFQVQPRRSVLSIRGRTQADTKVTVRAETTAIVRKREVEKGDWVTKGTLLCELDVGSRQANLAKAEAALAQAEFDLNAKQKLAKKGFAAKTQIAALKAQRDAALAGTEEASLELGRTKILAPTDGEVQGPLIEVGDQLKAGDPCAVLMDPNPMLVVGQVSEREVQMVKVGAKADVTLVTGEQIAGTVRYVSTTSDIETRTFLVEVQVANPNRALRDGVTAVAKLSLDPIPAHRMSPAHLTLSDAGLVGVMAVEKGKAAFKPVTIIANDTDGVWVAGLAPTTTVITVGQEYVKDGEVVEAVDEAAQKITQTTSLKGGTEQ